LAMSDIVMTGWSGLMFAEIASHTLPVIADYARKHGLQCGCANLAGSRPPSWMKLVAIQHALDRHDRVVWVDADVVIANDSANIFDCLGENWQAVVEHHTPSGTVPNCGVWVLTRQMLPVLAKAWEMVEYLNHPWWEQAAVLRLMGYAVTDIPTAILRKQTQLTKKTTFLDSEWNHHPEDAKRVESPRFVHVTQYADRLGVVKSLCSEIRGGING